MKNGWLDRQGKFYSCRFAHHEEKARAIERDNDYTHTLEWMGWIRVHDSAAAQFTADSWHGRKFVHPTKRQIRWLLENGYDYVANSFLEYYYAYNH